MLMANVRLRKQLKEYLRYMGIGERVLPKDQWPQAARDVKKEMRSDPELKDAEWVCVEIGNYANLISFRKRGETYCIMEYNQAGVAITIGTRKSATEWNLHTEAAESYGGQDILPKFH
jgi:hypothetical protein